VFFFVAIVLGTFVICDLRIEAMARQAPKSFPLGGSLEHERTFDFLFFFSGNAVMNDDATNENG
jgi:hypothetical protein